MREVDLMAMASVRVVGSIACATFTVVALLLGRGADTSAECMWLDRWPSFERGVRSAHQVLVGEVTEALWTDTAGQTTRFRFRVDHVLRAAGPSEIVFDDWAFTGDTRRCDKVLSVRVGDRLALAFRDPVDVHPTRAVIGVAAFLNRDPSTGSRIEREYHLGLKQMSLERVGALVALPPTDTARPVRRATDIDRLPFELLLTLLVLGTGVYAFRRFGQEASDR